MLAYLTHFHKHTYTHTHTHRHIHQAHTQDRMKMEGILQTISLLPHEVIYPLSIHPVISCQTPVEPNSLNFSGEIIQVKSIYMIMGETLP